MVTEVQLSNFVFALPVIIENNNCLQGGEGLKVGVDFPQEFFGLMAQEQLSIVLAFNSAALKALDKLNSQSGQIYSKADNSCYNNFFPIAIGVRVEITKTPNMNVQFDFNMPTNWEEIPLDIKTQVFKGVAYLAQSAAKTICMKEEVNG